MCLVTQGGQGKYSHVSLLLTVSLTNVANVNDPLTTLSKRKLSKMRFSIMKLGIMALIITAQNITALA